MDELDKTVANAFWLGTNKFQWDATGNYIEASSIVKGLNDIAAAIRSRFVLLDKSDCKNCIGHVHLNYTGKEKPRVYDDEPGPATGEEGSESKTPRDL